MSLYGFWLIGVSIIFLVLMAALSDTTDCPKLLWCMYVFLNYMFDVDPSR